MGTQCLLRMNIISFVFLNLSFTNIFLNNFVHTVFIKN